jgi:hypothetical protein
MIVPRPVKVFGQAFEDFWIEDGRRDAVRAAGPLAQIDGAAAIAAKGKVLILLRDDGVA